MSLISIKHVFGIRTSLTDSIAYLDEHCYLYPSSRHIIFYNIDYKSQRLIHYGNEYERLESLTISPNKQYLAIALTGFDKCRIIIYNLSGNSTVPIRRQKILSLKETIVSHHIRSLIFSMDSKLLLTL